jgi:flavin-binding protein dodecin
MSDSVYKIVELVGSSTVSWEDAAKNAILKASKSLRDLRIAEVLAQDIHLKDGKIAFYRTKIKLSFKYEA